MVTLPHVHRHLAFLRAINVAGRRVTNADLCAALEGAGFAAVTAYQAAGNLVVDADTEDPTVVAGRVEQALRDTFGWDVPTFVRSREETHAIAAATPFEDDAIASATSKPQVILLLDALDEAANSAVASLSTEVDQLVVDGREVHWLPVGGVGRAALDLDGLARITGPTTVRTAGTIQRMAATFLAG